MSEEQLKPIQITVDRRKLAKGTFAGMSAAALARVAPIGATDSATRWQFFRAQNADATPESIDAYAPQALSETEYAVLRSATGRLIPTDELGPGAIEAGVSIYIDRILAGTQAPLLSTYQSGLSALDAATAGFSEASEADQDAALTELESGSLADAPEGFFGLLLEHTRQGMFGDPIHGGNREFIGWDLINYPGIKIVWTAEDQAISTVVEPQHISVEKFGGTGS